MSYRVEIREWEVGTPVATPATQQRHPSLHEAATAGRRDAHLHASEHHLRLMVRVYGEQGQLLVAAPIQCEPRRCENIAAQAQPTA